MTRYERMYYKMKELEGTKSFKICLAKGQACACTGCVSIHGIRERYFEMYKSGELKKRIEWFATHKKECYLCPKSCAVNREIGQLRFCKTSNDIHLASALLHYGEEPPDECPVCLFPKTAFKNVWPKP